MTSANLQDFRLSVYIHSPVIIIKHTYFNTIFLLMNVGALILTMENTTEPNIRTFSFALSLSLSS